MLIWTAKVNRRKIGLMLAGVLVLCGVAVAVFRGGDAQTAAAVSPKGIKTAEDRAAYLSSWGWQVEPEAVSVEELAMPEEFGVEYSQYLELQSGQGFDLTRYAGKRIKRYTWNVLNYPDGTESVQAHLLLYKNTVIGGEIVGESFLHGLAMPE